MVAKSWNAARTGFPGLPSQEGIRRSFSRRACAGLMCRDAQCAVVVLAVVAVEVHEDNPQTFSLPIAFLLEQVPILYGAYATGGFCDVVPGVGPVCIGA